MPRRGRSWPRRRRARRTAYLSLRDNGDGTTEGRFRLPSLHAGVLAKVVQALTAPRRIGAGRLDPVTGKKLPAATLAGQGLMELVERHLNLDSLPHRSGSPFKIVVTIPVEQLCAGVGVAVTDIGVRISAGQVRRLGCAAGFIPMVLDGESVPLDLGRVEGARDGPAAGEATGRGSVKAPSQTTRRQRHQRRGGAQATGASRRTQRRARPRPHHHMADHPESWAMHRQPDDKVRFHRRT